MNTFHWILIYMAAAAVAFICGAYAARAQEFVSVAFL